jgi:L-iditol 2-dehydrogenase
LIDYFQFNFNVWSAIDMKVLRLHAVGDLRLQDEDDPLPEKDECLLRIKAVGICGSDLHWYEEAGIGDARLKRPLVLGHEFAGIIDSGEHKGRKAAVDPAIACRRCRNCEEGNPNLCDNVRFAGHDAVDGALREKLCWPESLVYVLPDEFSAADGAMLEPLGVALHALSLGHVLPGMSVGIFGCGPIGLLLVQLARAAGAARIIATDRLANRLDAARAFGASHTILAADGRENAEVDTAAPGDGVDIAFEAAGDNEAVATAIRATRPGRQIILIGIPDDDRTVFQASIARRKGLTLKLVRRMKHTYPRAIQMVQSGIVDVRSLVTHRYPLSEYKTAFETAKNREGIKVVIEP